MKLCILPRSVQRFPLIFKDQALRQSSSYFKVSNLEIPRGASNYEDIPSGLFHNHIVVIDTEICTILFRETVTQSLIVLVCKASNVFSGDTWDQ